MLVNIPYETLYGLKLQHVIIMTACSKKKQFFNFQNVHIFILDPFGHFFNGIAIFQPLLDSIVTHIKVYCRGEIHGEELF